MVHSSWIAGAVLALATSAALAAPLPVVPANAMAPRAAAQPAQFYYSHPYSPYYAPPPPPVYYVRPRRAPDYGYPPYGYYDKEAAKDYVKAYRRGQKEILKDQARAWNRAHGF